MKAGNRACRCGCRSSPRVAADAAPVALRILFRADAAVPLCISPFTELRAGPAKNRDWHRGPAKHLSLVRKHGPDRVPAPMFFVDTRETAGPKRNPTPNPSRREGSMEEARPHQGGGLASRLGLALGWKELCPCGALSGGDEEWKRFKRQANLQTAWRTFVFP